MFPSLLFYVFYIKDIKKVTKGHVLPLPKEFVTPYHTKVSVNCIKLLH